MATKLQRQEYRIRNALRDVRPREWIARIGKLECRCLRHAVAYLVWWRINPYSKVPICDIPEGEHEEWMRIRDCFPGVRRGIVSEDALAVGLITVGFPEGWARRLAGRVGRGKGRS